MPPVNFLPLNITKNENFKIIKEAFLLLVFIGIVITIVHVRQIRVYDSVERPIIYRLSENFLSNNLSCFDDEEYRLVTTEDPYFMPPKKSIFFTETSCKGGIDSRQACAIESAAKANPDWNVYVLMAGPLSNCSARRNPVQTLSQIENIHFVRARPQSFSADTPLESIFMNNNQKFKFSKASQVAELVRFLALYKYGGVYLDFDMVVVKSFNSLPRNFIVKHSNGSLETAVLSFDDYDVGNGFTDLAVRALALQYKLGHSGFNSSSIIQEIVNIFCKNGIILTLIPKSCQGLYFLDSKYFFPIEDADKTKYFLDVKMNVSEEYAHYIWNGLNNKNRVPMNSLYAELAKTYCPKVYGMYGKNFGLWKVRDETDLNTLNQKVEEHSDILLNQVDKKITDINYPNVNISEKIEH